MTMTTAEFVTLHKYIDKATSYLEFGSGWSTIYASKVAGIRRIDSVESSEDYVNDHVKTEEAVAVAISDGRLNFHLIDLGETAAWGFPVDRSCMTLWPNYCTSVFSRRSDHDLVLVDGRFRVACVLQSLLHAKEDAIVMVHDFERVRYHVVLEFVDVIEHTNNLIAFRRKVNFDRDKVESMLKRYQYMPSDSNDYFLDDDGETFGTVFGRFVRQIKKLFRAKPVKDELKTFDEPPQS